jgi:hypothetical protein
MNKLGLILGLMITLVLCTFVSPAFAQASRTWVSGVGDDANPCSRTAPCKTFAGAISKTATLGEINCLDPAGFGSVTITKSITIDCHEVFASILNAGTNGVVINFNSFTDARKTVRLRNLNFNGFDTGTNGVRILGAAGSAGSEVFIEDCLIDGNFGGTAQGISDERTGGGELSVSDTTVRNTGSTGIGVVGGVTAVDVTIDNVRVQNSNFGVAIGNSVRMMISNSVFSGNTTAGVRSAVGGIINIDDSVVTGNGTGVSNNGTIRLSNTDVAFNGTGISGTTLSFGNNRISGNTAAGTAPTLIGAVSNPFGQQ